ncbi:MAG: SusC/RagA family TonB-linked outer membrane protein [Bacteroidota bacterium]
MKKVLLILGILFLCNFVMAQKTVTGKVTSKDDGSSLPGVTVLVKGTTKGASTDLDGKYSLKVPANGTTLVFSFVGMKTQEVEIGSQTTINVVMEMSATEIEGAVVTALGITREKKSLGYATQDIKGDQVNTVKSDNFVNALSGKVSGVQVKKTTNMGGSTNVLLRGSKSLTGNNQVLFVIDGVPVNNDVTNSSSQKEGGLGYDYGNAASDINPDDIESINVLKGSAATALYGSRASGGVIMITTKKGAGAKNPAKKKGVGVTLNSGVTVGFIDKSTFPKYQNQYGAGYGKFYEDITIPYDPDDPSTWGYWNMRDMNGIDENGDGNFDDDICTLTSEDASFGAAYDPNLLVYQWDALDPESPNYRKATPWVVAKNGPITFFEHPVTFTNSVSLDNAFDKGMYRFSYTNFNQKGLMPNSELKKDNVLLNGSWNVNSKLTATGTANYTRVKGLGRNSTGYSDNIMGSFRQWMQTNVDIQQQQDLYELTDRNITWNYADPTDLNPIYWDNYYWTRYKNYQNDGRNRFIGNMALNYKVNEWLDVFGRISADSYNEIQEERRAVGSIATPFGVGNGADGSLNQNDQQSGYLRRDISFSEYNYDLMLNFTKQLTKDISLKGILGNNTRRSNYNRMISSTSGGLNVSGLYSLQNSVGPLPFPKELASRVGVNGTYLSASFGYKDFLYLDATARRDHSSTLPEGNNIYYYPSVATSFIFTNVIPKKDWLSFGKARVNFAKVGNSADFDQLIDNYNIISPFNGAAVTSVAGTKKNPDLKPEKTSSIEAGLEMYFFQRRIGFDFAFYKTNTTDQILPLALSPSTGYTYKIINAGEIENKGVELMLNFVPVKKKDFKYECSINWAKNKNTVVSLMEGLQNLQLGSYQGGVTINAMVGKPYGVIYGTDYIYLNGEKVVDPETGNYMKTATSDNEIGNVNPVWNGGFMNTFTYKSWQFSFLIDVQKGGDIFSLDMYYGLSSGLYEETAGTNDLGNPLRDPIVYNIAGDPTSGYASTSGGYINPGVNPDGSVNETRANANDYSGFGYAAFPDKAFVYDASYIKLREVSISYVLPSKMFEKCFLTGATFSLVGSNVWIIFKNLPYADPESGLGAGNLQGYSTGSLPSTRDFGFNLKLNF